MKTIEEKINQYLKLPIDLIHEQGFVVGFKNGVRFAQTWINVNDELPPTRIDDKLNVVLGKFEVDHIVTVVYDSQLNEWLMMGTGIPLTIVEWRPINFV